MRRPPKAGPVCLTERTAGVDWFRYRVNGLREVRAVRDAIEAIQDEDRAKGSKLGKFSLAGYTGPRTESIRYGLRGGKLLWETSGEQAPYTWTRVPLCGGSITRVDLQVTLRLSTSLPGFGMRFLPPEATTPPFRLANGTGVWWKQGAGGYWHGQVAARTADAHFRLYDKGGESGRDAYNRLWRLELEAKYSHAEALGCQAEQEMRNPEWCGRYVESLWRSQGLLWPIPRHAGEHVPLRMPERARPTAAKLGEWLIRSVRPVIPRLLTVYSVNEILQMLDLDTLAAPVGVARDPRGTLSGNVSRGAVMARDLPLPPRAAMGSDAA